MRYDAERSVVLLSVRELCARALQPADLDLRPGAMRPGAERAEMGRRAHRLLQKRSEQAGYRAEVTLTNTTLLDGICYEVSGRADGVLHGEQTVVEEIKSVGERAFERPPSAFAEAQAMCYAYFLAQEEGLSEVAVKLTLYRTEDGKTRSFGRICSANELREHYLSLLASIAYRARLQIDRMTVRLPSVHSGRFPYSGVREGQDLMLKECYRDIRAGKRLFVQAPTGTGKTISTLYPAVRALGEGYCDKIFYLTAKASTRTEAYRASAHIYEAGSHLRTVVLTSREQICANAAAKSDPAGITRHCNPATCPRAKDFYVKCPQALCRLLEQQSGYPRASVEEVAREFGICPYEFQLELSEFCDTVICDYNYVFDPMVYLRRYFEPEAVDAERYVFLIDEAHNLADRAVDMYSAELKLTHIEHILSLLNTCGGAEELKKAIGGLSSTVNSYRRLCQEELVRDEEGIEHGFYLNKNPMLELSEQVARLRATLERWLYLHRDDEVAGELTRFCGELKRYECISEAYDEHFLTFIELCGNELTVRETCLDPSKILDALLNRAHAAVLFSATLTPTDYFADILGGGKGAVRLSLPSPFRQENFCIAAATGVSTRYEDRERSVKKLASIIAATVSGKAGNYIVYFPSYDYMGRVHEAFSKRYPTVETVVQTKGMTATERESFLDAFSEDRKLRVGFCVLGGSFSEGVDLPGKRLIGSIIVGVGLPGLSNERNLLREHYDTTRERGYDYAYTYPGMNRVLQAAGRVIRREDDRGVIVLVDDRYATDRYKALLPEHWSHLQYAGNATELANIIGEFWSETTVKRRK